MGCPSFSWLPSEGTGETGGVLSFCEAGGELEKGCVELPGWFEVGSDGE